VCLIPRLMNTFVLCAVRVFMAYIARDHIQKIQWHEHLSCEGSLSFPRYGKPSLPSTDHSPTIEARASVGAYFKNEALRTFLYHLR
jgi:hypothetical protein